jgi:hypothetical protein
MNRAACVILVALITLVGCSATRGSEDWVTQAESAHHVADERLAQGDIEGARQVLRSATEIHVPKGTNAKDARVVRQDLYYRLAALEVSQNRLVEAQQWANAGLGLGRGNDVFTANLYIARGKALERRGDASGASRDYHDALLITEALLDKSLGKETP